LRSSSLLPLLLSLALAACAGGGTVSQEAVAPSFDCAKAVEQSELLVCDDPQLARLDAELGATYARAESDPDSVPSQNPLRIAQQTWVAARNACAAEPEPRTCLVRAYARRIQELRLGSAIARSPEAEGIAFGPFAMHCEGIPDPLIATFINAEPNLVYLTWSGGTALLTQGESASGARYLDETGYLLWNKGNTALFQSPGAAETTCGLTPI